MKKHFIFSLLFVLSASAGKAQTPRAHIINPLQNDDFKGFEVLDSTARYARFILSGEDHRFMQFNSRMELKFMQYLHRFGVRHMIMELGYARGYVLQQYLNSGDSVWRGILKATTGKKYMKMYQTMRDWNRGLPDSAKITVSGIDVERFTDIPVLLIEQFLPDSGIPSDLLIPVEAIKGLARYTYAINAEDEEDEGKDEEDSWEYEDRGDFNEYRTISNFVKDYDSLSSKFKTWLGKDFGRVDTLVNSLRQYLKWDDYEYTTYQYVYREKTMFDNMMALVQQYPTGRFFGQFGRCHAGNTVQNGECNWYNYVSIAHKMEQMGGGYFKGRIATIGYFYAGDDDYDQDKLNKESIDFKDETPEGEVALFALDSLRSAYPEIGRRFDFVLYNNKDQSWMEDEDDDDEEDDTDTAAYDDEYKPDKEFVHITGLIGYSNAKLSGLQTMLTAAGLPEIDPGLIWQGVEVSYINRGNRPGGRLAMTWVPTRNFTLTNDTAMRFNAFNVSNESLFDILRDQHFNLAFATGMAYQQLQLELSQTPQVPDLRNPGPNWVVRYRNPAVLLTAIAQLKASLGPLSFGLNMGYGLDISRKGWRYNGQLMPGIASTSQSGAFAQATVGFVIKD
jgi:hypothetical protein